MMNNRVNWKDIKARIAQDDKGKADYIVPIEDVRMSDIGTVFNRLVAVGDDRQLGAAHQGLIPNDHALGQLFSRLGMNRDYFRKAYAKDPYLAAEHINYWIETGEASNGTDLNVDERDWMIRAKNDTMRAVLTDRYAQVDNSFAFDTLSHVLNDESQVRQDLFYLDDRFINTRLVFPDMKVNVGTIQKPDHVFVGVHIVNSEVGSSSYRIESCLWRQVCSNGLIVRVEGEILLRQRHTHITASELERKVAEALGTAVKQGDTLVDMFARSRDVKIENPLDVIKNLAKQQKYSQAFTDSLINSYNTDPEKSAYGVVNAFTHAAKNLDMEKRLEIETFAGNFMQEAIA